MNKKNNNKIYILIIVFLLLISLATILITKYNKWYDNRTDKELRTGTVVIKDGKVKKKNENKLVLVTGKLDYNDEILHDSFFIIHIKTPKLLRYVEMYQWKEYTELDNRGQIVYKYEKVWSNELIDSSKFKNENYKNPKKKSYETKYFHSKNLKIGEFNLSKKQREMLNCNVRTNIWKNIPLREGYKVYNNFITNSKKTNTPEIGDIRIAYFYNDWKYASIYARQSKKSFTTYTTKNKENINELISGIHELDPVIEYVKINVLK